jgi:hypothetical protein
MRAAVFGLALIAGGASASAVQNPPSVVVPAPSQDYKFTSAAGMLFFHVRPERTADFEAVVARLIETLDQSADPVRKQQAANWRVLKSLEAGQHAVVYIFAFDPVVAGADYDPVKILGEGAPTEVHALYDRLRQATIKIERMALQRMR